VDRTLEFGPGENRAEHWTAWLENAARAQAANEHRVVADAVNNFSDHLHGIGIIAGHADGVAVG
jgi:hypothetical protein